MKTLSKIFENIAKLIDVKSIITLSLLYILVICTQIQRIFIRRQTCIKYNG